MAKVAETATRARVNVLFRRTRWKETLATPFTSVSIVTRVSSGEMALHVKMSRVPCMTEWAKVWLLSSMSSYMRGNIPPLHELCRADLASVSLQAAMSFHMPTVVKYRNNTGTAWAALSQPPIVMDSSVCLDTASVSKSNHRDHS